MNLGNPATAQEGRGAKRKRAGGALCNFHAGCSALCLALGAAEERKRERETQRQSGRARQSLSQ